MRYLFTAFLLGLALLALSCTKEKTPEKKSPKSKRESPSDSVENIKTISQGERVNINDHLVKGKYTLVEFYADW